jgi:glycosyltransferase involved in cell wall biosynthesis
MTGGRTALRILTLTTSYPRRPGDWAGRFVRDLNAGFRELGHGVSTLAPWEPGLSEEEADDAAGTVRRVRPRRAASAALFYGDGAEANARRLGAGRALAAFWDQTRAFSAALAGARGRADLVVAHWVFPSAWWCAGVAGLPPVAGVLHGADARLLLRPVAGRCVARRLRGRLHALVCVSRRTAPAAAARLAVPPDRVAVTAMGLDPATFRPDGAVARAAGLVVAAGRLVPSKGFRGLVRACAGGRLRLVIAGEGPEREALAALARDVGVALELPGMLGPEDLAALYRRAAVVAVPSAGAAGGAGEGVPLVAIEALACGAPVVGAGVGGLPDLLGPHALARGPEDLRPLILAALADPGRFQDPGARERFDRVAVARRVLEATGSGAGSSRTGHPRPPAATP